MSSCQFADNLVFSSSTEVEDAVIVGGSLGFETKSAKAQQRLLLTNCSLHASRTVANLSEPKGNTVLGGSHLAVFTDQVSTAFELHAAHSTFTQAEFFADGGPSSSDILLGTGAVQQLSLASSVLANTDASPDATLSVATPRTFPSRKLHRILCLLRTRSSRTFVRDGGGACP